DPRRETHYRPSAAVGEFTGIINGIDAASSIVPDQFARPGLIWRENTVALDFNYLTAWETDFLLAEAALKGYLAGEARPHYEAGVLKAFDYWQTQIPGNHLSRSAAAWNEDRGLELIITQKWIASIGNAYEAWAEWRRTGFPALKPVAASLNGGVFPVRMPYPNDEQALNFDNYQTAAAATNDNSINVPVWWDVE
ncbi:MAG: SusD/RagB family nutrient-binding outer membrane lipoprotein, partial [Bacteroidota bacterium]